MFNCFLNLTVYQLVRTMLNYVDLLIQHWIFAIPTIKLVTKDTEDIKKINVMEKLFLQRSSKADDCNALKLFWKWKNNEYLKIFLYN